MLKVYVFRDNFLTDYIDGLGVIFAHTRKESIKKMAHLIWGDSEYTEPLSKLNIREYTMEDFPGVYTHGGS